MKEKHDQRREFTNVWKPFFDGQRMIPDLEKIKASENQTQTTMYLPVKSFTINTTKSCSPSGETASSATVNLSWLKKNFAIKINKKQFQNNELTAAKALANNLFNAESSIWTGASGLEAAMVAYLNTNRTYVNALSDGNSGTKNTWSAGPNYEVEVTNANRGQFWNYMMHDMMYNNYSGKLWDICNTWSGADALYYSAQGQGNSANTQFQWMSDMPANVEVAKTNLITASGYHNSERYIVPEGGVAALFWNNPLNRAGEKTEAGEWTVVQSMMHPEVWYDVFIKNTCADTTSDGGTTQDSVVTYEFTINYALTHQPMSVTNETPIFKYVIKSS
jgi:hypothetical protein